MASGVPNQANLHARSKTLNLMHFNDSETQQTIYISPGSVYLGNLLLADMETSTRLWRWSYWLQLPSCVASVSPQPGTWHHVHQHDLTHVRLQLWLSWISSYGFCPISGMIHSLWIVSTGKHRRSLVLQVSIGNNDERMLS